MVDTVDRATRSRIMAAIKSKNTGPERLFAAALRRLKVRPGRWVNRLPGRPDFTVRPNLTIFIDGCFFHGCPRHGTIPKTHTAFWREKISANKRRDLTTNLALRNTGWRSVRFWECEVRKDAAGCALAAMRFQHLD